MKIPAELAVTLVAIVDEGSLDGAAAVLGISQPAVSQRLRTLESIVGRVLLIRSRPVRATPAGHAVVRFGRQLAHLEADVVSELGIGDREAITSLPIAVNSDSLGTWFLPPLAALSERLPVVFDLHRDDQDFTVGLLERGTVLAAVTSREQPIAGCRVTALGSMRYRPMATAAFHRRWFADGVTPQALQRAPLVDFDARDDLQTRWLISQGVDPTAPPRHRVPASSDFADAVLMGLGWGQLLPFQADDALEAGRIMALDDSHVEVPLYWQRWNVASALLDEVEAEIVRYGRSVLAHGVT